MAHVEGKESERKGSEGKKRHLDKWRITDKEPERIRVKDRKERKGKK